MHSPMSNLSVFVIYCHVLGMCSVTNNTTRVRIGYRIYSLWRSQLQMVTITETTIALAASHFDDSPRALTDVN
jgi:hypothetical protein